MPRTRVEATEMLTNVHPESLPMAGPGYGLEGEEPDTGAASGWGTLGPGDPVVAGETPDTLVFAEIYYNPLIKDERFVCFTPWGAKMLRFNAGVFVASNPEEEIAVRNMLLVHGKDKPDRWHGNNRYHSERYGGGPKPNWQCPKCSFATGNEEAQLDHENSRIHE